MNPFQIILQNTFTLTQLKDRLRVLKTYLLKHFFGGEKENFSPDDLAWLQSLPTTLYAGFNKDNLYEIFSEMEAQINKLSVLTIYLTFEPDLASLNQLGTFARSQFGPSMLLDIKFNPALIAGAALVWKGISRDYSLKSKIETKKEEILQNFKQFLR